MIAIFLQEPGVISSASVMIAISFLLANRARFAGLLSLTQRSTSIFSLFFLKHLLSFGDDAARNFSGKTARPAGALRIFSEK